MGQLIKYTKEEFAKKYSLVNIRQEFGRITTTAKAISATNESLALCRKHLGEDIVIDMLSVYLGALMESINVNQPLTLLQIEELSEAIISKYYHISVVEFAFVLKRGSNGEFGKVNTYAFNKDVVMDWFDQYQDERCAEFQKKQEREHYNRINGKVEVTEEGKYMTVFEEQFNEQAKKNLARLKDVLPESKETRIKRSTEQVERFGMDATFIDNSNNEELKRLQREAIEKYGTKNEG